MLRLAQHLGLASTVLTPLRAMYHSLSRRFQVVGHVGEAFVSTNGILQGCPLSVILLNMLINVWANAVEVEVPDASVHSFADDTGAIATDAAALQRVLDITGEFGRVTGQRLNAAKSKAWGRLTRAPRAGCSLSVLAHAKAAFPAQAGRPCPHAGRLASTHRQWL